MRNRLLWGLLAGLLMLLAGWAVQWFYANFEQRTREAVEGMSPAAKKNPLLAAERFLNRLGVATESLSGRDRLLNPPGQPGLLLVYRLGASLPAEREQALLGWVRRGGHLLVAPRQAWDEAAQTSGNRLLDSLGVQPDFLDSGPERSAVVASDALSNGAAEPAPVHFEMPGSDATLAVAFSGRRILHDSQGRAEWSVETEQGAHLLRYALGAGKITVMSDLQPFSNRSIGAHDHALLLAALAGEQRHAWLLYSSTMPVLPLLLWRQAPGLVVSSFTLVLLLLWSLTRYSGPRQRTTRPVRRNLMEHLGAAGRYLWRIDRAAGSFRRSQRVLEQAWRRRHPALGAMQRAARCQWIAKQTGLPAAAVEQALYGDCQGEQGFIQVTATQQRLAAQLHIQKEQHATGEKGSG